MKRHSARYLGTFRQKSLPILGNIAQVGTLLPYSHLAQQQMARHEQVREGCQHIHLAAVLKHAAQAGLLKAELPLDHAEWMFTF
jgi:hypothetical protein